MSVTIFHNMSWLKSCSISFWAWGDVKLVGFALYLVKFGSSSALRFSSWQKFPSSSMCPLNGKPWRAKYLIDESTLISIFLFVSCSLSFWSLTCAITVGFSCAFSCAMANLCVSDNSWLWNDPSLPFPWPVTFFQLLIPEEMKASSFLLASFSSPCWFAVKHVEHRTPWSDSE